MNLNESFISSASLYRWNLICIFGNIQGVRPIYLCTNVDYIYDLYLFRLKNIS